MDLGKYLEQETKISKEEINQLSRKPNYNWANEFTKAISPLLIGARVSAFDDSYGYEILGVKECDKGYVCVENKEDGTIRLSAILSDWIEVFPKSSSN